jgi:hypothetical protein
MNAGAAVWVGGAVVASIVASTALLACSLLVPADEAQCATADDCHARGPSFANAVCVANVCRVASDAGAPHEAGANDPWACLDGTPLPSDPTGDVDVQVLLYNALGGVTFGGTVDGGNDLTLVSYVPEVGVSATACSSLDPDCASPIAGPTSSDDGGIALLRVPGSFSGFYALSRPDSVPSLFFPGRLLVGEPGVTFPTSLTSTANFSALQSTLGITANRDADAGPGLVAVTQYDCNDRRAGGVAFAATPPSTRTLYLENGFPSTSATKTAPDGSGLLVDVPSGSVSIASTLVAQGNRPLDQLNVLVRSGAITLVKLRPRTR